jgi:putative ABC transport system ATP-binding protein
LNSDAFGASDLNGLKRAAIMLELIDLSKSYIDAEMERSVLCDVNASVQGGEFLAIRGRSGSGKTTLLNLIAGIDEPDSGEVLIDGLSIHEMTDKERAAFRRDNIGFVFQFFNLLPTLKVIENVSLPAELARVDQKTAEEQALTLLDEVGLADRAHDFPDKLSGGEQQRVAIARALIQEPKVILADEPTGNLDSATGEQVLGMMIDLSRLFERSLLLVTHSHQIASRADRVLTIQDCRLIPEEFESVAASQHSTTGTG